MKEFIGDGEGNTRHAKNALDTLLAREAGPDPSKPMCCSRCGPLRHGREDLYRCSICIQAPILCHDCLKRDHIRNPLHVVECGDKERRFW